MKKLIKKHPIKGIAIVAVLLLVISLLLMWKSQSNPIIFGLSSNVVAGYVFYVVIELIPRKMKERKALKVLHPQLVDLEHALSTLLGVVEGLISIDENDKVTFSLEKKCFIVDKVIWCERIPDFILQFTLKVQTKLSQIIQSPLFRDLDENRAEIIAALQISQFFSHTLTSVAKATEQDQNTIRYGSFRSGLEDVIAQYNNLFCKKPTAAREANFDEVNIYSQRIIINRQMFKNGEKGGSFMNGIGVQEL